MRNILLLTVLPAALLVSCATEMTGPYHPATPPEKVELDRARLNVYPEDVRKDLPAYAAMHVAWAGIIVTNNATEDEASGKIHMATLFDNHYFDWEQKGRGPDAKLAISPRGEGLFRMNWNLSRKKEDASQTDAMKYAAPGNLAIVYGTPLSIGTDGMIDLRYHYIRVLDLDQFTTNELDYGRMGEPVRPIATPRAAGPSPIR
ncbi:MAG TPA: hypothetical protein VGO59_00135 [Verrucomicrobiae bacterium]|jgi:hypothetical protein